MNQANNKITVLVVDDQEAFLQAVVDELKFLGFNTIAAKDGQEAFDLSTKNKFDLIISDIRMPNKDGRWFLQELRKTQKTSPPFLFMTGFADLSIQEAYGMGVDGFLGKPLNPDKLESLLTKLVQPLELRWNESPKEKLNYTISKNYSCSIEDQNLKEISLGRGGIYLSMPKLSFEVGDIIGFKLQFSAGPMNCLEGTGTIVWKKENPEGVSDEYGLYFESMSQECLPAWLSYVRSNEQVHVIPQGKSVEQIK